MPVAAGANFLAMNLDARLSAANRRPEVDRRLILEIAARLRAARLLLLLRAREDAAKNIFEAAPARRARSLLRAGSAALESRKIEPTEIHRRPSAGRLLPRIRLGLRRIDLVGVKTHLVVNLALLVVAQHVVGFGDFLELLLRLLVAGIHVRMIFARSFAKGLANLIRRRRLLHAEHCVVVFVGGGGHFFLCSILGSVPGASSAGSLQRFPFPCALRHAAASNRSILGLFLRAACQMS